MSAQKATAQSSPNIDVTSPYTPRRPSPIVSISINHPITKALRKIKNFLTHKQTLFSTSFTIKVTPIVAIVSFFGIAALFGGGITTAFNFGKTVEQRFLASTATPTPTPQIIMKQPTIIIVSRSGTIKATYQMPPDVSNTPQPTLSQTGNEGSLSASHTMPTPTLKPTPAVLRYILLSRSGSIVFLITATVHLQNYLNLPVLLTGAFDSAKNTLTIAKPEDIEVLQ